LPSYPILNTLYKEVTSTVPVLESNSSKEVLAIDEKCKGLLREIKMEDLVVWVDPLDGTSEFVENGKSDSRRHKIYFN
jgi:3'-phosphoadenosine 5'-phosphosulfate (PAPS) 3'-phosphatase